MNRSGILFSATLLAATLCYGQGSPSAPVQAAPAAIGHGAFPVTVVKTLDSSKLKEGDAIELQTVGSFKLPDGTLIPKGSRLTGHVAAAKARSKGDPESELTLTFEKLNVVNGKQLTLKGAVQAVAPPVDRPDPGVPSAATAPGGNGTSGGAVGLSPGYTPNTSNSNASANLGPNSVGVQGMNDLELKDGVLSSKGKNVKLGDGVRMIVHVDIQG